MHCSKKTSNLYLKNFKLTFALIPAAKNVQVRNNSTAKKLLKDSFLDKLLENPMRIL